MKKTWITTIGILLLTAACDSKFVPRSQDADGNCRQAFLESYNKIEGSSFDLTTNQSKDASNVIAENCKKMLKTYGTESEACLATDMKTGKQTYLSTKDLRDTCSQNIPSKYYGVEPTK